MKKNKIDDKNLEDITGGVAAAENLERPFINPVLADPNKEDLTKATEKLGLKVKISPKSTKNPG